MYLAFKHLHLTLVALSIFLFVMRFIWLLVSPRWLDKKTVKIVPHVIDTFLLLSAVGLCIQLAQYPLLDDWVTAKVFGVVAYIVAGFYTLKKATNLPQRLAGFGFAIFCLGFTAMVAVTKQAWPFA